MPAISQILVANPMVIFREELDGWAVLFDPDANETFALDPVSTFIWKLLDGKNSKKDILAKLNESCKDGIPKDASQHLDEFLDDLTNKSLIGFEK